MLVGPLETIAQEDLLGLALVGLLHLLLLLDFVKVYVDLVVRSVVDIDSADHHLAVLECDKLVHLCWL